MALSVPQNSSKSFRPRGSQNGIQLQCKNGIVAMVQMNPNTMGSTLVKFEELKGRTLQERYTAIFDEDLEMFRMSNTLDTIRWPAHELKFYDDIPAYRSLPNNFKLVVRGTLAFFLFGDGVVTDNLLTRFALEANTAMERRFFIKQMDAEIVHQDTYLLFAHTYEGDELKELRAHADSPPIKAKIAWMERWMGNTATRSERLFAFICVEGIVFPFLFLVPTFLEELGLMLIFAFANKMIARDEANHAIGGIKLLKREQIKTQELLNAALQLARDQEQHTQMYQIWNDISNNQEFINRLIQNGLPVPAQPELFKVAEDGVAMIDELLVMIDAFVDYFLPEPLTGEYVGFTARGWKNYARLMADQALVACGAKVHYKGTNDFPFLDRQGGDKRHNFFERFGIYSHGNVEDRTNWRKLIAPPEEVHYNPFNDDREI